MTYTVQQFTGSLAAVQPPADLEAPLQGLWWDAKGDWDQAHKCVDQLDDRRGMRVHAYLHRKEGDLGNAAYWYRRVGQTLPDLTLDAEHAMLVKELLAD
jgi:hypothetical protein